MTAMKPNPTQLAVLRALQRFIAPIAMAELHDTANLATRAADTSLASITHTGLEIAAYLLGGPFGITASMWAYRGPFTALLARLQARKHPNTTHQPNQG